MSVETRIQEAVARADLIICGALRWLAIVLALTAVLALGVLIFHRVMWNDRYHWMDPTWIDYDAPGWTSPARGHKARGRGDAYEGIEERGPRRRAARGAIQLQKVRHPV